jgi:putative flippase GtrA
MDRLIELIRRTIGGDIRWLRYVAASVLALATDAGLFLMLHASGMEPMAASASGYIAGIGVHWLVSSRLVFAEGAAARGSAERTRQKGLFVVSALIGLAITTAIVGLFDFAGFDARIGKLVAIVVSFQVTYMLRKSIVFRSADPA